MNIIYIQIGSNIGDRKSNIHKSMQQIKTKLGKICCSSKIYESSPWGYTNQKKFLNSVIKVESEFNPFDTLEIIQEIENNLERGKEKNIDRKRFYYNLETKETSWHLPEKDRSPRNVDSNTPTNLGM